MLRLHDILDKVSAYIPDADLDVIRKAYIFSAKAHQGQVRRSGEPYLIHPLEVAGILADMKLDIPSIATALLHDTVEDTVATLEEVEQLFGAEVRQLVDGVTKLGKIRFRTSEERQAENFRKMIMAMAKDIRVILVKLADRVHNMRTLDFMPEEKRIEIAQETTDIYAPIANRLGMQRFKIELEDLSLKHLKPDVYKTIVNKLEERKNRRDRFIDDVRREVSRKMAENNVPCEIQGRLKHISSIHKKMESQNIPFDQVYDLIAFRMVVDTLQQCYEALGVIHSMWTPIPGRFKDYIAMPKANNYQSLHTTVIGLHGERIEFQIRTREMHEFAERGIAAHWKYKEGGVTLKDKDEMKFKWIRQLLEWHSELSDPTEFLDTVKLDLFADDVYCFTPKGELRELPRGSTPIDFAYDVHSEVGNTCIGSKVNGKIVPLRYHLHSGDIVEILTQKGRHPNKDWLQFVKTSRAKAKIRQFLKSEESSRGLVIGRELLEKECSRYGVGVNRVLKSAALDKFMKDRSYINVESLLIAMSYGKISPHQVVMETVPEEDLKKLSAEDEAGIEGEKESILKKIAHKFKPARGIVKIDGISDVLVSFGNCCNPVPGDKIIGYITRGRGVIVHLSDCQRVLSSDSARRIEVEWDTSAGITRAAKIKVVCVDRPGMLVAMTEAITEKGANISKASIQTMEDKKAVNVFEIEIGSLTQLRQIMQSLERLKGIISVDRLRN